jgi:exosortase/archaeosortase family protein
VSPTDTTAADLRAVVIDWPPRAADPSPAGRRSARLGLRAALLVALVVVSHRGALRYTYAGLIHGGLDPTSPLVFVPFVPVAAAFVAAQKWRSVPAEPNRPPQRAADVVIGVFFVVVAAAVAAWFPSIFRTDTLVWRADLVSLAPFVAGVVALLFGGRMLYRCRSAVVLLTAMGPALYRPLVVGLRTAANALTDRAVGGLAPLLSFVRTASTSQGRLVAIDRPTGGFSVIVTSACAGAGAVLAASVLASTVVLITSGRGRDKLAWAAFTVTLAWVGNLVRLLALFVVGRVSGVGAMMDTVHPWIGVALLGLTTTVALTLTRAFGLQLQIAPRTELTERTITPPRLLDAGAVVLAAALIALPAARATTRYDLMSGMSRRPVADLAQSVGSLPGAIALDDVSWASQFFGATSRWSRWLRFDPAVAALPARATGIDVTWTRDPVQLDQYGLAACFGFHDFRILSHRVVALAGDRRGELIVYADLGTAEQVTVLSFRQAIDDGGIERIVAQRRAVAPTTDDDRRALVATVDELLGAA